MTGESTDRRDSDETAWQLNNKRQSSLPFVKQGVEGTTAHPVVRLSYLHARPPPGPDASGSQRVAQSRPALLSARGTKRATPAAGHCKVPINTDLWGGGWGWVRGLPLISEPSLTFPWRHTFNGYNISTKYKYIYRYTQHTFSTRGLTGAKQVHQMWQPRHNRILQQQLMR